MCRRISSRKIDKLCNLEHPLSPFRLSRGGLEPSPACSRVWSTAKKPRSVRSHLVGAKKQVTLLSLIHYCIIPRRQGEGEGIGGDKGRLISRGGAGEQTNPTLPKDEEPDECSDLTSVQYADFRGQYGNFDRKRQVINRCFIHSLCIALLRPRELGSEG